MQLLLAEFDEQEMVWFIIDHQLVRYDFADSEMAAAFLLEYQQEIAAF